MPVDAHRPDSAEDDHQEVVTAFADRVERAFDEAVVALYLFGSVAAGIQTAGSDVDVLAVVADDADYGAVDDRLLDIAYDILLTYGVPVEVHTVRQEEFEARRERGEPFVSTVVREGTRV